MLYPKRSPWTFDGNSTPVLNFQNDSRMWILTQSSRGFWLGISQETAIGSLHRTLWTLDMIWYDGFIVICWMGASENGIAMEETTNENNETIPLWAFQWMETTSPHHMTYDFNIPTLRLHLWGILPKSSSKGTHTLPCWKLVPLAGTAWSVTLVVATIVWRLSHQPRKVPLKIA